MKGHVCAWLHSEFLVLVGVNYSLELYSRAWEFS